MYLQSIHNFRALAILIIVMGHMYAYGLMSEDAITLTIINFLTGATALFVFISGFMFHHVFFDSFKYQKFVMAKVKNVLVPYLILSSLAIAVLYTREGGFFRFHFYGVPCWDTI
jgi:surface polysaccharide O-acyltransferase-like enzyme